jgi:hypothetical protein
MYQLIVNAKTADVIGIKRISDGAGIPIDPMNSDYQEYLKWVAEGNEPLPPDSQE